MLSTEATTALEKMRRFAKLSDKRYAEVIKMTEDIKRREMARPPQGRHVLTELEAEYRAFNATSVKYAIADQQFMERLTNQWAAVAQAEILASLALGIPALAVQERNSTSEDWRKLMGNLPATFVPDPPAEPSE